MQRATPLVALGLVLIGACPASASVVRVRQDPCFPDPHGLGCNGPTNPVLEDVAGPGEHNTLTIAPNGGALVVTDSGASVQAQAGCTQVDSHNARCPAPVVDVRTGDGAD